MVTRPESGLVERMRAAALDQTLEVDAGETIGAPAASKNDAGEEKKSASAEKTATKKATSSRAFAHSLPRISLGEIDAEPPSSVGSAAPPDLHFVKVLGEGGMGRVHLASQKSLRREVAVKTLKEGASRHAHEALLSEARVTGFLAHPGIIPVHSLGLDDDDQPVLVMKRIEGVPWKDLLGDSDNAAWSHWDSRTGDRLEVHLQILMKICDALHFAHSQAIVHRDIKPENVMLGLFGEVYLVDWGLAVSLADDEENHLVGSPAYMAPEMALGSPVDARTDVYLLGATLHEVLTGEYLHTGKTLRDLLEHAIASAPYVYDSASVPTELAQLCARATAREPSSRPASAEEFRQALADYLSHRSSIAVSNAAQLRLEAAEESQSDTEMSPRERAYHLGTHCAEARFGFREALRAWPDNEAARHGLEQSKLLLVDAHLLRRDAVGALAEIQSMRTPSEARLSKVAELEDELAGERRERERLKDLDREADQVAGFGAGYAALLSLVATVVAMTLGMQLTGKASHIDNVDSVLMISALLIVAILVIGIKREKLFANTFYRRLVAFGMACILGIFFNRLLGWQLDTPVRHVLVGDAILVSACAAVGGYTIGSWIWWMSPFMAATAGIITFVPSAPHPVIFAALSLLGLIASGLAWLMQARRQSSD